MKKQNIWTERWYVFKKRAKRLIKTLRNQDKGIKVKITIEIGTRIGVESMMVIGGGKMITMIRLVFIFY